MTVTFSSEVSVPGINEPEIVYVFGAGTVKKPSESEDPEHADISSVNRNTATRLRRNIMTLSSSCYSAKVPHEVGLLE